MTGIHELKIYPEDFEQTLDGNKPFQIRINDKNYKVGDTVILKEWNNMRCSGKEIHGKIRFLLDDSTVGIEKGYVIFTVGIFKVLV